MQSSRAIAASGEPRAVSRMLESHASMQSRQRRMHSSRPPESVVDYGVKRDRRATADAPIASVVSAGIFDQRRRRRHAKASNAVASHHIVAQVDALRSVDEIARHSSVPVEDVRALLLELSWAGSVVFEEITEVDEIDIISEVGRPSA